MTELAVVILNWNGVGFLEKFLPSVIKHTDDDYEIWVADNASTDHSVAFLNENYPNVYVHINEQNGGFAKGYNDALKQIKAKNYVLLNSDVEVTEGWIDETLNLLNSDPKIAACQPNADFSLGSHLANSEGFSLF